jgi:hypothetical protein
MAETNQQLDLDTLIEVIDTDNNEEQPDNIDYTSELQLTEIYNDSETPNAVGKKSFIDQLVIDYHKRDAEFETSKAAWKAGEISGLRHFAVGEVKKAMLIPDTVGNAIFSVLDFGWKNAIERPASVLESGVEWLMPGSAQKMEEIEDGFSKAVGDKLAQWYAKSPAAQEGIQMAMEGKEKYDEWCQNNPNDCMALEAAVDIPLFFWPAGKAITLAPRSGITHTPFESAAKTQKYLLGKQQMRVKYDDLWAMLNFKNRINKDNQRRVTQEGYLTRMTTINYNPYEKEYMDALMKVGVKGTANPTKNNQIISNALETEAKSLLALLSKNEAKIPIPWSQTKARLRTEIDKLLLNPMYQTTQQKNTIEAQLELLFKYLDDGGYKGTPQGILQLRQFFDKKNIDYKRGANLDGTIPINALDDSTRVIRQTLNKIVSERVPNAKVTESLKKQTYMYNGLDDILPALQNDAWSAVQRTWKNAASLIGIKMDFNRIMAVAFGASAYGMASLGVAGVGVAAGALGGVGIGIAIQTRTTKRALGMLLSIIDKAIKVGTNPNTVKALSYDRAAIKELFERPIEDREDPGV